MWPEANITNIEFLYWYLYQIDIKIWETNERVFISSKDLFQKLSEAGQKNLDEYDKKETIEYLERIINWDYEENRHLCLWDDVYLPTIEEAKKELYKLTME